MDRDASGRSWTRRQALVWMGSATGTALLAGWPLEAASGDAPAPSCVLRPEQTEGPYFVDERLHRADLRSDPSDGTLKPGVPLRLTFRVSRLASRACTPLLGALVDVWHCDAAGVYSDVEDPGFKTRGKKFLRGYQVTDASGSASFTTIYPGGYPGRAVHVHFKIREPARPGFEYTSQLYFDDATTDAVHARAPYAAHAQRALRNAEDALFAQGGTQLVLALQPETEGYAATFDLALKSS
jgi:protocatechuate 3,4-dioxygenase beta subunit